MLATTVTNAPEPSPSLYHDALLLSHLARSIASDACAVYPSCTTSRENLAKYGDDATWKAFGALYRSVANAIGRPDLAATQVEVMPPIDAWQEAWKLTGTIATKDGRYVLLDPDEETPLVEQYLAAKRSRAKWKFVAGLAAAAAVGTVAGVLVARRR